MPRIVPFPKKLRAVLVDWDGTFCDSREKIYDINVTMANKYGVLMPSFECWLQASHPSVEICMEALGVTEESEKIKLFFKELLDEKREAGFRDPLYSGTEEILTYLRDKKIPMVVISRHPHDYLLDDIGHHGLTDYFYEIIGEPDDTRLEKDVAMRHVCNELCVQYGNTVYLGDTSHDMVFAEQAGVCPVAVSHGYDPVPELAKTRPAEIFGSLPEFQEFLEKRL
jgi:phosphoglycolate phosphatase